MYNITSLCQIFHEEWPVKFNSERYLEVGRTFSMGKTRIQNYTEIPGHQTEL